MADNPQTNPTYQRWYEKHKQELSQKRKLRYQNDPAYRQKILDRKHKQLEKAKAEHQPPAGYVHTMQDVADGLGVTVWTIREWRKKGYFPAPLKCGRNLLFTDAQFYLLRKLEDFLQAHGKRLSRASRDKLQDEINLIHANWN